MQGDKKGPTHVDLSSAGSNDDYLRAISQSIHPLSITKICLNITHIEFNSNPGGNALIK